MNMKSKWKEEDWNTDDDDSDYESDVVNLTKVVASSGPDIHTNHSPHSSSTQLIKNNNNTAAVKEHPESNVSVGSSISSFTQSLYSTDLASKQKSSSSCNSKEKTSTQEKKRSSTSRKSQSNTRDIRSKDKKKASIDNKKRENKRKPSSRSRSESSEGPQSRDRKNGPSVERDDCVDKNEPKRRTSGKSRGRSRSRDKKNRNGAKKSTRPSNRGKKTSSKSNSRSISSEKRKGRSLFKSFDGPKAHDGNIEHPLASRSRSSSRERRRRSLSREKAKVNSNDGSSNNSPTGSFKRVLESHPLSARTRSRSREQRRSPSCDNRKNRETLTNSHDEIPSSNSKVDDVATVETTKAPIMKELERETDSEGLASHTNAAESLSNLATKAFQYAASGEKEATLLANVLTMFVNKHEVTTSTVKPVDAETKSFLNELSRSLSDIDCVDINTPDISPRTTVLKTTAARSPRKKTATVKSSPRNLMKKAMSLSDVYTTPRRSKKEDTMYLSSSAQDLFSTELPLTPNKPRSSSSSSTPRSSKNFVWARKHEPKPLSTPVIKKPSASKRILFSPVAHDSGDDFDSMIVCSPRKLAATSRRSQLSALTPL